MYISVGKTKNEKINFDPVEVNNFDELASTITSEFPYSLATYKNGYRNKANFESASCIGLDFDGDYSIEQAIKEFGYLKHIIATTRSHQIEKNGVTADRFRVILFLEEAITDELIWNATWHDLATLFPATDPQCKDTSRFWYPSTQVVSINKKGSKVKLVIPEPVVEKPAMDLSNITPGMKGKLGKDTLEFLVHGKNQGSRNHSTFKAAKDFQQNLYSLEEAEATIVNSLNANGTIARDFTEAEVIQTIKSAFNGEAKHDPRIKLNSFKPVPIAQLYKATDGAEILWLVKDLLQVGGVSLLAADPKTGKSVIARQLCANVLNGTPFLSRETRKGSCHYYGVEESATILAKSFFRLGIKDSDPLFVHSGDPVNDVGLFEDFADLIKAEKPALAVVDTAFDIIQVESDRDYASIKKAFKKVRKLARETGTHIMLIHHAGKPQQNFNRSPLHAVLGSTAITAGVDNILVIQLKGSTRVLTTGGRDVEPWNGKVLVWDDVTKTYSLGKSYDDF